MSLYYMHLLLVAYVYCFKLFCLVHSLNLRAITYIGDKDGMAATGTVGHLDKFDGTKDDWLQYVEHLEHSKWHQ